MRCEFRSNSGPVERRRGAGRAGVKSGRWMEVRAQVTSHERQKSRAREESTKLAASPRNQIFLKLLGRHVVRCARANRYAYRGAGDAAFRMYLSTSTPARQSVSGIDGSNSVSKGAPIHQEGGAGHIADMVKPSDAVDGAPFETRLGGAKLRLDRPGGFSPIPSPSVSSVAPATHFASQLGLEPNPPQQKGST